MPPDRFHSSVCRGTQALTAVRTGTKDVCLPQKSLSITSRHQATDHLELQHFLCILSSNELEPKLAFSSKSAALWWAWRRIDVNSNVVLAAQFRHGAQHAKRDQ